MDLKTNEIQHITKIAILEILLKPNNFQINIKTTSHYQIEIRPLA